MPKIIWPADLPLATIDGQTERRADGRILAWYETAAELATCLELTQYARELAGCA